MDITIEKDDNFNAINKILAESETVKLNKGFNPYSFQKALAIEPTFYLTVYTEMGEDEHFKKGYVIDIETEEGTFSQPVPDTSHRGEREPTGKSSSQRGNSIFSLSITISKT